MFIRVEQQQEGTAGELIRQPAREVKVNSRQSTNWRRTNSRPKTLRKIMQFKGLALSDAALNPPVDRQSQLEHLLSTCHAGSAHDKLQELVATGLDRIPYPGQGQTLDRWKMLAAVAADDLSLVKLYEGHTDALAILAEIGDGFSASDGTWGVWCAEPPDARVKLSNGEDGTVLLNGRKAWCSGAAGLSHALISAWNATGEACLVAVDLSQPGVTVTNEGWHAVGMADSQSVDVKLTNAVGVPVGPPGAYLSRPGFWHGGAGIAACWYGAACFLARRLHAQLRGTDQLGVASRSSNDPIRLAQLGEIDMNLQAAAAILHRTADEIDRSRTQDARETVLRARLIVETAAMRVQTLATRALGAGPLCREAAFARMAADLPVFLRQSHAERDMASLGALIADREVPAWAL